MDEFRYSSILTGNSDTNFFVFERRRVLLRAMLLSHWVISHRNQMVQTVGMVGSCFDEGLLLRPCIRPKLVVGHAQPHGYIVFKRL